MWSLINTLDWEEIRRRFSWFRDLEGVPQDPQHHAEGDVATHTRMVVEALQELPEYADLPPQEQQSLRAAALLHDVEKRSTTVQDPDGRIHSRGHAQKGEYTARSLLYREYGAPFAQREMVAKLVRYHGLPLWIFDKPDPVKSLLKASWEVDTRLLALLAKADVLGRYCADQGELLERVALFEEFCREQLCYGQRRVFAGGLARFHYFQREQSWPDYEPFDDRHTDVILLSGLPGAGKDTYIRKHLSDWPVVSLDDLREELEVDPRDSRGTGQVVQLARERAREHLRRRRSFVWNATNLRQLRRGPLVDLFSSYGARLRLLYVETSYPALLRQNAGRADAVPEAVLERMIDRLEMPSPVEAPELQVILDGKPFPEWWGGIE